MAAKLYSTQTTQCEGGISHITHMVQIADGLSVVIEVNLEHLEAHTWLFRGEEDKARALGLALMHGGWGLLNGDLSDPDTQPPKHDGYYSVRLLS